MRVNADELDVRDNGAANRYEARVGNELAMLTYRRSATAVTFLHASVPPALEGQGIASRITRVALEDARAAGLQVIPRCGFVAAYLRRHPQYADLLAPSERAQDQA